MNRVLIIAALLVMAGVSFRVLRREAAPSQVAAEARPVEGSQGESFALEPTSPRLGHVPAPPTKLAAEMRPATVRTQPVAAVAAAKNGKPPIQDLLARLALAEVGLDADAEEYWLSAINDPTLGAVERQDLIEDLNEDGFEDPENLTAEDIPLILSRIDLIETHAPMAMDQVNADAFAEAYKDLWNMLDRASAAVAIDPP